MPVPGCPWPRLSPVIRARNCSRPGRRGGEGSRSDCPALAPGSGSQWRTALGACPPADGSGRRAAITRARRRPRDAGRDRGRRAAHRHGAFARAGMRPSRQRPLPVTTHRSVPTRSRSTSIPGTGHGDAGPAVRCPSGETDPRPGLSRRHGEDRSPACTRSSKRRGVDIAQTLLWIDEAG
jgi:hypothetical protein